MSKKSKIDMTQGPMMKNVLLFALPLCIGNILQQLYTTVDKFVIGSYCGKDSLAAVGTSAQPLEMFLCIFLGIGTGISILVAQTVGGNDTEKLNRIISNAITFLFACSIPIGIIGLFGGPAILKIMGVPEEAWDYAVMYLRITFLGSLGNMGYNLNAGILKGLGDSKASLLFLVISCVVNIILDFVFVAFMGMDVSGAALSTIIAMYVSWIVSVVYIRKKYPEVNFTWLPRGFNKSIMKEVIAVGLPLGLNHSIYSLGHIAMQSLVNAQGTEFMAGASAAGTVTGITNIAVTALASATTTFAGQNYGAKDYKRLKSGHLRIPLLSGGITLAFALIVLPFREPILSWFTTGDDMVLMYASRYVFIMLLSQWMYAVFNGIMCFVNGFGVIKYTTVINVIMLWGVRIPAAYIIANFFDGTYVMLAITISFAFAMICMFAFYMFSKRWKEIKALATE